MGSKKVCFEGEDGQYGTCIRDDEDCMQCEMKARGLHYEMISKYNKNVKVTPEEHLSNISNICKEMDILRQIVYGLRQMSNATSVVGLDKVSDDLMWRANTVEEVMETTLELIRKHQHEEMLIMQYDNEQLNKLLKK
jgi:hypothetical protein